MKPAAIIGLLALLASGMDPKVDGKPIRLGCERPHVHLYVVQTLGTLLPAEAGERIAVSSQGSTTLVAGLEQLRGLVRITDGRAALRFVRLRTSPATWYMWRDSRGEQRSQETEIVPASRARGLPSFGLRGEDLGYLAKHPNGYCGILPDKVWRAAGFSAPEVVKEPGGFVVTRWVYSESWPDSRQILKIREVVDEDGSYQRRVLSTMDPRRVDQLLDPGQLMFPRFA
jgi:hypothetical protein